MESKYRRRKKNAIKHRGFASTKYGKSRENLKGYGMVMLGLQEIE